MNIILVRHGKATESNSDEDDFKRPLAAKGKRQINKIIPLIKKFIMNTDIILWSSPALRTTQTAQIISQKLKVKEVLYYDFLMEGNYSAFLEAIKSINPDATVIIAGHEPYLGEWSRELCGRKLQFKKGTAAVFKITQIQPLQGELKILIHPDVIYHENEQENLKKLLIKFIDEIRNNQELYLKSPGNIEGVHQIRVKIRQLRSILSFIKPLLKEEEYLNCQMKLRSMSQRFSYIRQLDVLNGSWEVILKDSRELLNSCGDLKIALNSERNQENSSILKYISEGSMDTELQDLLKHIEGWNINQHQFSGFAVKRVNSWYKNVEKLYRKTDFNNIDDIHKLRIKYKKLRYVQNTMNLNKSMPKKWKLERIQDELGKICDTFFTAPVLDKLNEKYALSNLKYESGILMGHQLFEKQRAIEYVMQI